LSKSSGGWLTHSAYEPLRFRGRFGVARFGAAVLIALIAKRRMVFTSSHDWKTVDT
jgi:hypothetical protein